MEIAAAAFGLIGTITKLVKDAENASAEKSAAILARLQEADAVLNKAQTDAHEQKAADDADMSDAIRKAESSQT